MRYDLCSPRPKRDGGTFWHRVGTMFPSDKGGFSIILDSLPIPDKDGKVYVAAFEPKDGQRDAPRGNGQRQGHDMPEDEIPF